MSNIKTNEITRHFLPCQRCGEMDHCACYHDACCICGSKDHIQHDNELPTQDEPCTL